MISHLAALLTDLTPRGGEIGPCSFNPETECNSVSARIAEGPDEGTFALETEVATRTPVVELVVGDDIVLNDAGPEVDAAARYLFADVQRRLPLVILAVVFGVAVVALRRLRGLLALVGIGITVGVLLASCSQRCCGPPRRSGSPSPAASSSP